MVQYMSLIILGLGVIVDVTLVCILNKVNKRTMIVPFMFMMLANFHGVIFYVFVLFLGSELEMFNHSWSALLRMHTATTHLGIAGALLATMIKNKQEGGRWSLMRILQL